MNCEKKLWTRQTERIFHPQAGDSGRNTGIRQKPTPCPWAVAYGPTPARPALAIAAQTRRLLPRAVRPPGLPGAGAGEAAE